ncbi:phosphopantetheine-binding protein [Fulvivirga ulvae]|uniref:phosphopantetheine-binding protein n=1 Tax=Fulvivirga ulvae TaxID=2904245 RepID=UPI001F1F286F|nr:phosphopantetheine-binding protein [Fulvivirga ulvae]UII31910.1 phosphopantetheine-binding protein [Fulvivirga ulvae]
MTENHIYDLIAAHVAEITADVEHGPITRASMLSPLGMDSIGRAELIARMQEELSITVPAYEFHQANDLGELAAIFASKISEMQKSA